MTNPRKVLFIAGAGRSGTSTLVGLLSRLGLHVPQPEVAADDSNPKGFGEPQWVVDFHNRMLHEVEVQVSDSRPEAWELTGARHADAATVAQVSAWLPPHFAGAAELVIKDPRLAWFLPVWRTASVQCDATPVFATMLRPPAEVAGSRQKYYASKLGAAHLAAGWVNMLLHTELLTRDAPRVFVRYADLLDDWRSVVASVGEHLDLVAVRDAADADWTRLEGFIDPSLRRVGLDWADLAFPPRLETIAREAWRLLNSLADDDAPATRESLDCVREDYRALYSESEAISKSSVVAAEVRLRKAHRQRAATPLPPDQARLADRIPHGLRARIPAPVRRGIRRVIKRR